MRPDGPPVKDGKPYSAIAHLAEGLPAVVGMKHAAGGAGLQRATHPAGRSKPGLVLIENLGDRASMARCCWLART